MIRAVVEKALIYRRSVVMDTIKRVHELANERNISLLKLSEECGISYSTLKRNGSSDRQLSVSTIELICNTLNISLSEFFSDCR